MKLKTMLATAAIVSAASSAAMAEGAYVGIESIGQSWSYDNSATVNEDYSTSVYGGYVFEFDSDTELDFTVRKTLGNKEYDDITYGLRLSKEIENIELYGSISATHSNHYKNINNDETSAKAVIGARYNF